MLSIAQGQLPSAHTCPARELAHGALGEMHVLRFVNPQNPQVICPQVTDAKAKVQRGWERPPWSHRK